MKTITRHSKNQFVILVVLILSFLLSCSDDPSSPKKQDDDPIPQDVVTIGVEGGIVEKDDFTITIPAGTFDGNYDISVSKVVDDAFTGNSFLNSYKIEGVPNSFSKSMNIKFKHDQQINDDVFMAIGTIWKNEIIEDSTIIYQLNTAIDSSGLLIGFIPTMNDISNNFLSKNNFWAHPVSFIVSPLLGYDTLKTENFRLEIPYSISEKKNQIGELLEDSYKIAKDTLQLPFNDNLRLWKVAIKIQNEAIIGGGNLLNISRDLVSSNDYDNIKIELGKKFIELGLWNIIIEHKLVKDENISHPGFFTLLTAIQSWSEELLTNDQNFNYPDNFLSNYLAPFNGLRKGSGTNLSLPLDLRNGYGLASLIKYLVEDNRFGKLGIQKTFDKIGQGQYPLTAIMNTFDGSFVDWFPDFIKKYINDEIYNIPTNYFINDAHQNWIVDSEDDTLKSFKTIDIGLYPDLSARIFKIELDYSGFDESQNMLFSMKGPVTEFGLSLVVFGVQENQIVYLGSAHAQDFEIPKIKEYFDYGMDKFLVVLVNSLGVQPFLSESDIDFTININPKVELPACTFDPTLYDQCKISLWVLAEKETTNENGTSSETGTLIYNTQIIDGSFNENTFTGIFESESVRDTITVILNDNLNMVEYLKRSGVEENKDWEIYWEKGYTATDLLLNCDSQNKFEAKGFDVCNKVSEIIYNYSTPIYTTTLTDFSCEEVSSIMVEFSKK